MPIDEEQLERRRLLATMPLAELRARVEVAHRAIRELAALVDGDGATEEERSAQVTQFHDIVRQIEELLPLVRLTPEERTRFAREIDACQPELIDELFDEYDRTPEKYDGDPELAEMMAQARDAHERAKLHEELSIAMSSLIEYMKRRRAELQSRIAAILARAGK